MIELRTPGEIDAMRAAGAVVADMHAAVRALAAPGVRLTQLDAVARSEGDHLVRHRAAGVRYVCHSSPANSVRPIVTTSSTARRPRNDDSPCSRWRGRSS